MVRNTITKVTSTFRDFHDCFSRSAPSNAAFRRQFDHPIGGSRLSYPGPFTGDVLVLYGDRDQAYGYLPHTAYLLQQQAQKNMDSLPADVDVKKCLK